MLKHFFYPPSFYVGYISSLGNVVNNSRPFDVIKASSSKRIVNFSSRKQDWTDKVTPVSRMIFFCSRSGGSCMGPKPIPWRENVGKGKERLFG